MANPEVLPNPPKNNESNQKLPPYQVGLLLVIVVLTLIALGAGSKQWVQSLKVPFLIPSEERIDPNKLAVESEKLSDFLLQKARDTDNDGLSDYDETYLYKTSPYLEDSDSDKVLDNDEINQGTDPNCPEGQDCGVSTSEPVTTNQSSFKYLENLTADQLRSLLIQRGAPAEEVNKMDDQTLRSTYLETLEEISPTDDFSYLLSNTEIQLTADQIRQILLAEGVSQAEVDKLSDEDLLAIWQETVRQAQAAAGQAQNATATSTSP